MGKSSIVCFFYPVSEKNLASNFVASSFKINHPPAISVILPVYNAEAYVCEAVESILAQTFTDFECIIINDGSTDGSGAILRELAERDARIVLVERPNGGLVSALNKGLEMARADLIARMDADDVAMPERFALQHARMVQEPELAVLGSFIRFMDKVGNIIRLVERPLTRKAIAHCLEHRGCPVAHPAVMMRRDAVLKAGSYRKAFCPAEDYDLWLRMSDLGYAIANLPQPLLNYRWHDANVSVVHLEAQRRNAILARLAHRIRKARLPDPFDGVENIDSELIQTLPAHLRLTLEAVFFVDHHYRLSLAGRKELNAAWWEYLQLEARIQRHTSMCHFLMRLLKGAVRQRDCRMVLRAFVEAFRLHPKSVFRLSWENCQLYVFSTRFRKKT